MVWVGGWSFAIRIMGLNCRYVMSEGLRLGFCCCDEGVCRFRGPTGRGGSGRLRSPTTGSSTKMARSVRYGRRPEHLEHREDLEGSV